MTGIIVLDKPASMTSYAAVARLRRIIGEKKAGHTGTLDPMATGVLPVMLGGATRFTELLPCRGKGYRAGIKLGLTTDTLDITGKVLTEKPVSSSADDFELTLKRFEGKSLQVPPMYSALNKDGVRLYELARKGVEVERVPREIEIFSASLLSADEAKGEYEIDVQCSEGTYIRSLAADIGERLGCGAVLSSLRRTLANGFSLDDAVSLDRLEAAAQNGELPKYSKAVEDAMSPYPSVAVTPAQSVRFRNGGALNLDRLECGGAPGYYRVTGEGVFLGIGEIAEGGAEMTVKRVYRPV